MMTKSPSPSALTKLEVLAGAIHAFAAKLLAPARRPQPTRICPTLADTPDAPVLEDAPTMVTVSLATLRRVRLELAANDQSGVGLALRGERARDQRDRGLSEAHTVASRSSPFLLS